MIPFLPKKIEKNRLANRAGRFLAKNNSQALSASGVQRTMIPRLYFCDG